MKFAIETKDLTKKFNDLTAVDNLNIKIKEGEIFGLLGPNGAGKTTTISMLCTILKPDYGTAKINNYDVLKNPENVRKSIGIVFQDPSLDDRLTGRENLEMHAVLYGVKKDIRQKRIDEVLRLVELKDRADNIVKTYSSGMKRRLEIARGLIHYPKILFLDEPTLGLDPQTREHVWEYIKQLAEKEKITVVLTTHYMEEADLLCNRIAIIDHGKIIALDTPINLKNSLGGDSIILKVSNTEKATKIFSNSKEFDGKIALSVKNAEKEIAKILYKARKNKIKILEAEIRKPSLNNVFLHLTGREIREEVASSKDQLRQRFRGP
jgi:ABC-2 type transport system ATP-binding protein